MKNDNDVARVGLRFPRPLDLAVTAKGIFTQAQNFAAAIGRKTTEQNTMRLQRVHLGAIANRKYSGSIVAVFTSAVKQSTK